MTAELRPPLSSRFRLVPRLGAGKLRFGAPVSDYPELVLRDPEPAFAGEDFAEYGVPELEETLIVYVDGEGLIDSISFYEFCLVRGRDLIGMGVGEFLVHLGAPDAIEAEEIGRDIELLYAYDALGLTIWTVDGEVCVVQASGA